MPRKYSPEEKTAALELLERNGGNIPLTAVQTGIADRTLYRWRQHIWWQQSWQRHTTASPPPQNLPQFEDELDALTYLRRQIRDELLRLASFQESNTFATPQQRILFITQLLDRLMKLDQHLKPYRPKPQTRYHVIDSEGEEPGARIDSARRPPAPEGDSEQ
jgi:transposase-like protein